MKTELVVSLFVLCLLSYRCRTSAFIYPPLQGGRQACLASLKMSSSASNSVVVVSPPGGVGEITAVKAASLGSKVKWFVVSSNDAVGSQTISLSQDALLEIKTAGGSVEIAGAEASALLEEADVLDAVSKWCGAGDTMVSCLDGVENVVKGEDTKGASSETWSSGVKLAAREASKNVNGLKIAIMPSGEDDKEDDEAGGKPGFLSGLLGSGNKASVPSTISAAIKANVKLRHGTLFGIPESSPAFSALIGGPQKNPSLCEEYQMRMVRIDPSLSVFGKLMREATSRSSRHAVGEAAALMVTGNVPHDLEDICLTSLRGQEKFDLWKEEFDRVSKLVKSGQGAQLFTASFGGVPNSDRLTSWLATKWAPAVMRTYDLATIRTGARPVYASQISENEMEILWQELVNFESVTVGKMIVAVSPDGMVATRAAGDPAKGFGTISRKPLPGEDVLVRRLADAASQAIEKGLAKKPAAAVTFSLRNEAEQSKPQPSVVSSLQSTETIAREPSATLSSSSSGPRPSGARRSSERTRGGKRARREPTEASEDSAIQQEGAFE